MMNNKFMNLELGDFKGGKDPKSQGKGGGNKDQKGGHMMQNLMKVGDLRGPPKSQKTVKFNLPEDEFDDFDDFDEDDEDEFDDDDDDDTADDELEGGHRHSPPASKSKSKTKNHKDGGKGGGGGGKGGGGSHGFSGMMNMLKGGVGNKNKSGGKAKKGDGVEIPMQFKGLTGGNHNNDGKNMIGGKNGKGGKSNGQFVGAGPNGKGVSQNNGGDNWGHKGGGQLMMNNAQKGFHEGGGGGGGRGMGPMRPMGNYPMGNMAAVQGLPAPGPMKGGGYFPGMMGQGGGNPYNPHQQQQQQQYMAQMMMNQYQQQQQRPYGYDVHGGMGAHPMMHAPHPHPAMGYGPPMHPPVNDNFTHMFSDENTGSCSVM